MTPKDQESRSDPVAHAPERPHIRRLQISRFRGIRSMTWCPGAGLNLILGGGDVGKSTILDAVALLLSPTNPSTLSETDYYGRNIKEGFAIEAVMTLPVQSGIDHQPRPSWPWEWNGTDAVVPDAEDGDATTQSPVYRLKVSGTEDLELVYELVQPDGVLDSLTVSLRRSIGLVRLSGDDRNDRDLRLVYGSALDRLLSDKVLRSRIAAALGRIDVTEQLADERKVSLAALNEAFVKEDLPNELDLAVVGGHGASLASMVGLAAVRDGVHLPLASWGSGTRRLSALAVAQQNLGQAPVTVVDEVERGLEPYRQRIFVRKLQTRPAQSFATTHSPFVISAASDAAFWYVAPDGRIGQLEGTIIAAVRESDPRSFLSRLCVIAEGATEVGFVSALLERTLGSPPGNLGIHVCDAGSHEKALELLDALTKSGLSFAGFADNEAKYPERWQRLTNALGPRLFRWPAGCIEKNIIERTPLAKLEELLTDPTDDKTGDRLRTLAERLDIKEKEFALVSARAGMSLPTVMVEAATGFVPTTKAHERKRYEKHSQKWFKSMGGGRELEAKLFTLGMWPAFRDLLLPFCNAVRKAVGLPDVADLSP